MLVLVQFNTLNVADGDDFVYVGTEPDVGPLARIFSYTGNVQPGTWVSSGNTVTISMDTDDMSDTSFQGFRVTLTAVNPGGNPYDVF